MEEKVIIEGKTSKSNIISIALVFIAFVWLFGVGSAFGPVFDAMWDYPFEVLLPTVLFLIGAIVVLLWMNSCKIVVTDKRVYGKSGFGVMIDLPIDMISAVSTGILNSVGVSTASGKIYFWLLNNNTEVFSTITNLLLDRQKNNLNSKTENSSNADELKKYKQLLDENIITQEEFNAKKKQLLDL